MGPDRWPDADMLPFGSLRPHPGWGEPRQARLTPDETRTAFTLWAIARSPLILGGNLTEMDPRLRAQLTNRDVIALDQDDRISRSVSPANAPTGLRVWLSGPRRGAVDTVALFNVSDAPLRVDVPWTMLGLSAGAFAACDLWTRAVSPPSEQVSLPVAPHGVVLLRVRSGDAPSICG